MAATLARPIHQVASIMGAMSGGRGVQPPRRQTSRDYGGDSPRDLERIIREQQRTIEEQLRVITAQKLELRRLRAGR